jgi:hypothetical protein
MIRVPQSRHLAMKVFQRCMCHSQVESHGHTQADEELRSGSFHGSKRSDTSRMIDRTKFDDSHIPFQLPIVALIEYTTTPNRPSAQDGLHGSPDSVLLQFSMLHLLNLLSYMVDHPIITFTGKMTPSS